MSNEKDLLKEKILDLNNIQLRNVKESSYLNGIYSFRASKEILNDFEYDYKWSSERDFLLGYLDKVLLLLEQERDASLGKAKEMKLELLDFKNILESYIVELSILGELIDEYGVKIIAREKYEGVKVDPREVDKLIFRIESLLNDNKEDYSQYILIISEIIRTLPLRITKDNYFNIVRETLGRNLRNYSNSDVDFVVENYKKLFDGSIRDGYGTKLDYYFLKIEQMKKMDIESKSFEELGLIVDELILLVDELENINNIVKTIGIGTNMLITYLSIDIEMDNKYEFIEFNEEEKVKLLEQIAFTEKEILSNAGDFEVLQEEAFYLEEFDYEDLEEELIKTQKILSYYNDVNFTNIIFDEIIEENYLENSIECLVNYMNRSIASKSNLERRVRMKKLLSELELPFAGIKDFKEYVKYSLDYRVIKEEEMALKIDQLNHFVNEMENLGE